MTQRIKISLLAPLCAISISGAPALAQMTPAPVVEPARAEWAIAPQSAPQEAPAPASTGMVLESETVLSAETVLPGGIVLPAGTVLPAGSMLPAGTVLPIQTPTAMPAPIQTPAPAMQTPPALPAETVAAPAPPSIPNQPVIPQPTPSAPEATGGIPYVSGGIGFSEREELAQVKSQYNLRLLFAVKGSGSYLSDVKVRIDDATGPTLLTAVSKGPLFYVALPPGLYNLILDNAGQVQTMQVAIPDSGAIERSFYWVSD
ncbi:carboxypeptidase regulatory-like domain-containing protein [Thiobaca trueperi]|uniref:Carboxypeptidase family protein n=1 Tax=Thiobaca trueperi TaxID=127458 RepID=A0A4R3N6W9_9GAMM|nr:carboxypeptidase regulatory-like domain-containing protein [Thiobaca trueperi]TCT22853.1 hypothetical protein EDC35_102184 [Thiobaca trueperi]